MDEFRCLIIPYLGQPQKFLLCAFLCGLWNIEPIFTMMEETKEKDIQQSSLVQSKKIFDWNNPIQESFIFKATNPSVFRILVRDNDTFFLYQYDNRESKTKLMKSFSSIGCPTIENYTPVLYSDPISGHSFFYISTKEKSTFSQDEYSVKKFTILTDQDKPVISPSLVTHNSPIMHLGMVSNQDKSYLVSGSSYPSIKICDLEKITDPKTKKEAVITLHNRFLLGAKKNTLIYARKKTRRQTGLTRWLYSGLNKEVDCTICTLTNSFNKENENDKYNIDITISNNNYPISATNKNLVAILDKRTCELLTVDQNNPINKTFLNVYGQELEQDPTKITVTSLDDFEKYISDGFKTESRKVKKIYIGENDITIQTNYVILQAPIKSLDSFQPCYSADEDINNIYTIGHTLFLIKKDGLYTVDLS